MEKSIHSPDHERFCALLKDVRDEAGLSQEVVAGRLDKTQSFVSKYESGERRLDFVELHKVTVALEIDLEEFVHRYLRGAGDRPRV